MVKGFVRQSPKPFTFPVVGGTQPRPVFGIAEFHDFNPESGRPTRPYFGFF